MASLRYRLGITRARILKGVDPMFRCSDATPVLISLALGLSLSLALDSGATPPLGDLAISGQTWDGTHARVSDWSMAGVIGDIPNSTQWPQVNVSTETLSGCGHFATGNSDTTNGTNLQCIINYYNAHQQGTQGTVLYIPSGTYSVNGTIQLLSNLDFMCQSASSTTINVTGGRLSTGPSDGDLHPTNGIAITNRSPIPYGTTVFTTASAPGYSAGQWVLVAEDCDNSKFNAACSSNNNGFAGFVVTPKQSGCNNTTAKCGLGSSAGGWYLGTMAKVVSSVGTTVTLDRGPRDPLASTNPEIFTIPSTMTQNSGFENCTWNTASGNFPIYLTASANVWMRGNTISDSSTQGFFTFYTANATWRTNTIDSKDPAAQGSSTFRLGNAYEDRFEDNILLNVNEGMVIQSASEGNVFAYNFRANETAKNLNRISTLHGMYNHESLQEGNTGYGNMVMDDFPWGNTGPRNIFFRNVLIALNPNNGNGTDTESVVGPLDQGSGFGAHSSWIGNVAGLMHVAQNGVIGAYHPYAWLERNRATQLFEIGSFNPSDSTSLAPANATYWGSAANVGGTGVCAPNNDALCVGIFGPSVEYDNNNGPWAVCPTNGTGNSPCTTSYNGTTPIFTSKNMPPSLYLTAKPSWWCAESNWPAVGADVTTITGTVPSSQTISTTTPANGAGLTPAMRRHAGLSCTTGGGGLAALGPPGQPMLMP